MNRSGAEGLICGQPAGAGLRISTPPRQIERAAALLWNQGGLVNIQTRPAVPFRCVYCTYPALEGRVLLGTPVAVCG